MNFYLIFIGVFGAVSVVISAWASHQSQLSANLIAALALAAVHLLFLLILQLQRTIAPGKILHLIKGCILLALLLFCGGIYLKVLLQITVLSPFIPLGGGLFILAWLGIAFTGLSKK